MLTYSWMLASLEDPEQSEVAGNVAVAVAPGGHGVQGGWRWIRPASCCLTRKSGSVCNTAWSPCSQAAVGGP
jgi:hypothetical protein